MVQMYARVWFLAPDYVPQQIPMLMLRDHDLNNIHAYIIPNDI